MKVLYHIIHSITSINVIVLNQFCRIVTIFGLVVGARGLHAQAFTPIYAFTDDNSGSGTIMIQPFLILTNGVLYGTGAPGANGLGEIFSIRTDGSSYTDLADFPGGDGGANPYYSGLTLYDGVFYGTTYDGGTHGSGTVFYYDLATSTLGTLHSFEDSGDGYDCYGPTGRVAVESGILYGVTGADGNGNAWALPIGGGTAAGIWVDLPTTPPLTSALCAPTVTGGRIYGPCSTFLYEINLNTGTKETNYPAGGDSEYLLVDGALYGTTGGEGAFGNGSLFVLSTNGNNYSTIYSFGAMGVNDSLTPFFTGLTLFSNTFLGVTRSGGAYSSGTIWQMYTNGGGFRILYSFSSDPGTPGINSDGAWPCTGLVGESNIFYGMTYQGGANGYGVIYKIAITNMPVAFAAVSWGSSSAIYSRDGITWEESPTGLPSSDNWAGMAYGNGVYAATVYGDNSSAYSPDGINWYNGGGMPSSGGSQDTFFLRVKSFHAIPTMSFD